MENKQELLNVSITHDELDQLIHWHAECEKRCVEMKQYIWAQDHLERGRLFASQKHTEWYRNKNK